MNIANFITLGRLLLVPLAVWLIISDAYGAAFLVFVVAGISDGVDGYLARHHGMSTELGAYLDPLADKALLVSVYATLGFLREIPAWLVILVVSRDVLIVIAIIVSWLVHQPMRVAPLRLGKANTAAHIVFVVAVLGMKAIDGPMAPVVDYGSIVVGLLTAASGAAYLAAWIRHLGRSSSEDRRS